MPMLSDIQMRAAINNAWAISTDRLQRAVSALQDMWTTGNISELELEMLKKFQAELEKRAK